MNTPPKAVIFDLDGTLVDNMPFHTDAWFRFLAAYNIHLQPQEFFAKSHGTIDEIVIRLFGDGLPESRIKELGQEKEALYRTLYSGKIKPVAGLSAFMQRLAGSGIHIGLATMSDTPNIDFILDGLAIRHFFKAITGGHQVSKGKPDPEVFLTTMQKLNVEKSGSIAVEDSIGGVRSALAAGMRVIGIATSHSEEELVASGCFMAVKDYTQLAATKL